VNWNQVDEMVGCRGRGSQIEDPEVRIGGYGRDDGGRVWGEGGAIGAGVGWEGEDGGLALGRILSSVSHVSKRPAAKDIRF
jgi:hypothetical protein